ncbi:kinase-like protein [Mytilinidion resinicola]|uniref:Kinase-like protein n=1 Tax=Mytilinidion resinicola TaxID=574789 RepID=A0A6A6YRN8_9PEZI|nr:kinase-like protein [Mytilinidion resinicola]KAF2811033.1 kinase-like protein [Mytilinidion resinicola]
MDWSGRGRHAEFGEGDDGQIAKILTHENILGHSWTAVAESVLCRRIRLARKTISCIGKLKREDAVKEVEHLQKFLESFLEFADELKDFSEKLSNLYDLSCFIGCLSNAMDYIHQQFTKHMDIKPKNILIRQTPRGCNKYRVYFADFGISRAYKSAAEAETDSPTPYTRMYAAPEVVDQDTRGFGADIFSLGCVFAEIIAVLSSQRQSLIDI